MSCICDTERPNREARCPIHGDAAQATHYHLDAQALEDRLNVAIATIREARARVVELEEEAKRVLDCGHPAVCERVLVGEDADGQEGIASWCSWCSDLEARE